MVGSQLLVRLQTQSYMHGLMRLLQVPPNWTTYHTVLPLFPQIGAAKLHIVPTPPLATLSI